MKKLLIILSLLPFLVQGQEMCDTQNCEYIKKYVVKAKATENYTITWDVNENSCPVCEPPNYEWRILTQNLGGVVTSGNTTALSTIVALPDPGLYKFELRDCYNEDNPYTPEAETSWCSEWKDASALNLQEELWILVTELPDPTGGGID